MFFVQISDLLDALTLTLQESMAKTHPEITNLQLLSAVFHYMFFTLIDLWPFLLLPETSGRIPSHYSTFATPICLSQPLSGVACSNEWPWHHWSSTDWKWKDLGVSGTDAWALPGSICCCGCCMKFFFFFRELDWLHYGCMFSSSGRCCLQQSIQQIPLLESFFLEEKITVPAWIPNTVDACCMCFLVFLWLVGSHRLVPRALFILYSTT